MLNVFRKCEVYKKKKCHHILDKLPEFLVLPKELICAIKFL